MGYDSPINVRALRMGFTYLNLRFNEESEKPGENTYRVRYDSVSTEIVGDGVAGRKAHNRYSLLGTDKDGKKVAFYISKKILKGLTKGETYDFRLTGNLKEAPAADQDERREFGICTTKPRPTRSRFTHD